MESRGISILSSSGKYCCFKPKYSKLLHLPNLKYIHIFEICEWESLVPRNPVNVHKIPSMKCLGLHWALHKETADKSGIEFSWLLLFVSRRCHWESVTNQPNWVPAGLECSSLGKAWLNLQDSIFCISADCRQCSWRSSCHASAFGFTPRPVGRSMWRLWLCSAFEIQSSAVWIMAFLLSLLAESLLSLCRPVFSLARWV